MKEGQKDRRKEGKKEGKEGKEGKEDMCVCVMHIYIYLCVCYTYLLYIPNRTEGERILNLLCLRPEGGG
jgi:hypothetical protein